MQNKKRPIASQQPVSGKYIINKNEKWQTKITMSNKWQKNSVFWLAYLKYNKMVSFIKVFYTTINQCIPYNFQW